MWPVAFRHASRLAIASALRAPIAVALGVSQKVFAEDLAAVSVDFAESDGAESCPPGGDGEPADAGKEVDSAGLAEGLVALSYPDDKGERIDRLFTKAK